MGMDRGGCSPVQHPEVPTISLRAEPPRDVTLRCRAKQFKETLELGGKNPLWSLPMLIDRSHRSGTGGLQQHWTDLSVWTGIL